MVQILILVQMTFTARAACGLGSLKGVQVNNKGVSAIFALSVRSSLLVGPMLCLHSACEQVGTLVIFTFTFDGRSKEMRFRFSYDRSSNNHVQGLMGGARLVFLGLLLSCKSNSACHLTWIA